MQNIFFYYWKNKKIPEVPSSEQLSLALSFDPPMSSERTETSLGIKHRKPKTVVPSKESVVLIWA